MHTLQQPSQKNRNYSFINNTITILSVDDNPFEMANFFDLLSQLSFFNIINVTTAREAEEILSNQRVHVCLTELSIKDINNDPCYLPKTFSQSTHFLAISGQNSCAMGCEAVKSGILDVIDKPVNAGDLCFSIFYYAIKNILAPTTVNSIPSSLDRSFDILIDKSPVSVGAWAREQNIASCSLRELWQKRGISPKEALFIWNLYKSAFLFHVSEISGNSIRNKPKTESMKYFERFFIKRSNWLEIINSPIHCSSQITISDKKRHHHFTELFIKETDFSQINFSFN